MYDCVFAIIEQVVYAVHMRKTDDLVFVSDLHSQAFCEYELYLRDVRGIDDPGGDELEEGRNVHAALDMANFLAGSVEAAKRLAQGKPVPTTLQEVVSVVKTEQHGMAIRDILVHGTRLIGRVDQVDFMPDKVYVIDDKPPTPNGLPFISDTRQVQGYCLALSQEYPNLGLPLIAVIRDKYTGKDMWSKPFTQGDAFDVNDAVDRILDIRHGKRVPQPTMNPKKHIHCRWSPVCDQSKVER
jgi:CRISPR/Cas system-associated exonuclease Cas4 (RecB family)